VLGAREMAMGMRGSRLAQKWGGLHGGFASRRECGSSARERHGVRLTGADNRSPASTVVLGKGQWSFWQTNLALSLGLGGLGGEAMAQLGFRERMEAARDDNLPWW
jgi:hypothetical protein